MELEVVNTLSAIAQIEQFEGGKQSDETKSAAIQICFGGFLFVSSTVRLGFVTLILTFSSMDVSSIRADWLAKAFVMTIR
jgi:hypothetical protein